MKNIIGVASILLLWFKTADLIREFPFELKLPAIIVMVLLSLYIAFLTNLTDKVQCRK